MNYQDAMDKDGYALVPQVFAAARITSFVTALTAALDESSSSLIRNDAGIYGARNLLTLWPDVQTIWKQPPLPELLRHFLGADFGLVRVLYFDKPPGRSWSLPWHKDMTIAVRDNQLPSDRFRKPTFKAGVPHVEAPLELLQQMLTARIHLDDVTEENGPLRVLPGSHHTGKTLQIGETPPCAIHAGRGDVLLMRPLLAHCSGASDAETDKHRRILHLEFAGVRNLEDGYRWHDFIDPGQRSAPSIVRASISRDFDHP
jgi:hypothetical protein